MINRRVKKTSESPMKNLVTDKATSDGFTNVLADFQKAGSTGKALSSAGAAGDPWTALLAGYTDDATFGAWVKKLLSTSKFIGLK